MIFIGAQPRGKWLCVNDDSYGAFSLRPYFAGHVAIATDYERSHQRSEHAPPSEDEEAAGSEDAVAAGSDADNEEV